MKTNGPFEWQADRAAYEQYVAELGADPGLPHPRWSFRCQISPWLCASSQVT